MPRGSSCGPVQPAPLSAALGRGLLRDRHCSGGASAGPLPLSRSFHRRPTACRRFCLLPTAADFPSGVSRAAAERAGQAGDLRGGQGRSAPGLRCKRDRGFGFAESCGPEPVPPGNAAGRQGSTGVAMWGPVQPLCFAEIVLLGRGGTSLRKLSVSVSISLNPGHP